MESPPASCFIHHHPPAEARYQASPGSLGYKIIDESGFGGWADEKIESVREAAPNVESKKIHPQHLTISLLSAAEASDLSLCTHHSKQLRR